MIRSRPLSWAALLVLLLSAPATAYLPAASRILTAVAAANRSAGRTQALRLQVELHKGDGPAVGRGEMLSDPSGRVRLELRGAAGLLERHLRTPAGYRATRNGSLLSAPRHFAPPLPLLQASSRSSLRALLPGGGRALERVDLGRIGDHDCWVVGGRSAGPDGTRARAEQAALWVGTESHGIERVDLGADSWVRFGPARSFGTLVLPAWLEIHHGPEEPARLEILAAEEARPAPDAFEESWLAGP